MKKLHFKILVPFSLVIGALSLGLFSCDRIENPIPVEEGGLDWDLFPGGDSADYNWPTWNANTNTLKNVLLEDYTGHRCVNCPAAGTLAKQLEDNNPGRVFVASIHASPSSGFQAPVPPEFVMDFRTEAGTAYTTEMLGTFPGNPIGCINRTEVNGMVWQPTPFWDANTTAELATTLDVNLQVQYSYHSATNGLFVHTETDFINSISGTYNLIIFLVRDDVVAPQELPSGPDHHYHHHSVLSANINGTWGTQIVDGAADVSEPYYNHYSYELPDPIADTTYDINNLSLITFLCDRNSFEVKQVIKTPLSD